MKPSCSPKTRNSKPARAETETGRLCKYNIRGQAAVRAKIRDTQIYFDVEGAGLVPDGPRMNEKPVLFAVHGGPGVDHTGYKPSLSPLSRHVQIVYFDHRGQGRSARGDIASYTLENNVADMDALRDYLGLEKIAVLGGSYGGIVAQAYAAQYPDRVSHLILSVTASEGLCLTRAREILNERGTPEQIQWGERLFQGAFESDEQVKEFFHVMGTMYSVKFDAEQAKLKRERSIVSKDAINFAFGGFLRQLSLTASLPRIKARTLVIGARHDWICAPEFSELVASKIDGAMLHIFEESGHWVAADQQQAYLELITNFLTS